jgi:hypothetical protein
MTRLDDDHQHDAQDNWKGAQHRHQHDAQDGQALGGERGGIRRIELITGRERRRRWSREEKARITALSLAEQQFETVKFAADLGLHAGRQGAAIAGPQFFQAIASVAAQRFVVADALAEEQAFDAVDVLDPFGDQHLALAVGPAAILILGCVGTRTIEQTRGSPRLTASRARISASPSSRSVLARRWRRDTAIDAASTM